MSPLKNSEVGPEEIVGCRHQYFENGGKSARRDDLFSIRACNTQVQARRPRRAAAGTITAKAGSTMLIAMLK
jgi:hypothetical protein